MNKVCLVGRISSEVIVKYSGETAILTFSVAVTRKFKNSEGKYDADFISCKAFKQQAEFIGKYFEKGDWIDLSGNLRTGSYEKDGRKVYTTDVYVEDATFCGNKAKKEEPVNEGFEPAPTGFGF